VVEVVNKWARRCRGTTEYTSDLEIWPPIDETEFRKLLVGSRLRAYHCTRLLAHEKVSIKESGLRMLSRQLLSDRIDDARRHGCISDETASLLHNGHVFATNEANPREDQVCLVLSRTTFSAGFHGCEPLLTTWGGEGIYASSGTQSVGPEVQALGSPAIVVATVDLNDGARHLVFPALHKLFVGATLGFSDIGATLFYRSAIPPEFIEQVIGPSDRQYRELVPPPY
jgi:hypothetical protein